MPSRGTKGGEPRTKSLRISCERMGFTIFIFGRSVNPDTKGDIPQLKLRDWCIDVHSIQGMKNTGDKMIMMKMMTMNHEIMMAKYS